MDIGNGINKDLIIYINTEIIPCYDSFDEAHSRAHVMAVIENSLELAKDFDVDLDMVYTIAAYHDVGLKFGRKDHEKNSKKLMLADQRLKEWFTDEKIAVMAMRQRTIEGRLKMSRGQYMAK